MLTMVRLRASMLISITANSVVPLNLKPSLSKPSLPVTQFLGLGCCTFTSQNNMSFDVTTTTDATATPNSSSSPSPSPSPSSSAAAKEEDEEEEVVVQYVVLRRDLINTWPLGSVVTQGCHASVASIWLHKDDPSTLSYCSPSSLDSMHKVTLEVKGETQMVNLSEKLKSSGILHKLWIEQPENMPTCLATKPYPKSMVSPFFRKLKLCK